MTSLDTVNCSYNVIVAWPELDLDYSKCLMKTFDVSFNAKLGQPPVALLRDSSINKLQLTGCDVSKTVMLGGMEKNGVFEYQERHKKKLNQAVDKNLYNEFKLFGLE